MTTYVQMHNWEKEKGQPTMTCSQCGLRMPAEGAWAKAQYSSCLPNDHQWYWQQDKKRYYCFLCKQDVTYVELDSHTGFNPNSIVGAKCPQEGIDDIQTVTFNFDSPNRAVKPVALPAHTPHYNSMVKAMETYEQKFPSYVHEWLRRADLAQMQCAGCGLVITDEMYAILGEKHRANLFMKSECIRRALAFEVSGRPVLYDPPDSPLEPEPPSVASKRQILAWEV